MLKNTANFYQKIRLKIYLIENFLMLLNISIIGCLLLGMTDAYAAGTDLLAAQKDMISANFGDGSSLVYVAYMAEIISAIAIYIKSKNLLVLVGLVVVLIFTKAGFSLALAQ